MANVKFPDTSNQISGSEKYFNRSNLKVFTIYGHDGHLVICSRPFINTFYLLRRLIIKFGFDWQSGFRVKMIETNVYSIYMYIDPDNGRTTP